MFPRLARSDSSNWHKNWVQQNILISRLVLLRCWVLQRLTCQADESYSNWHSFVSLAPISFLLTFDLPQNSMTVPAQIRVNLSRQQPKFYEVLNVLFRRVSFNRSEQDYGKNMRGWNYNGVCAMTTSAYLWYLSFDRLANRKIFWLHKLLNKERTIYLILKLRWLDKLMTLNSNEHSDETQKWDVSIVRPEHGV